MAWPYDPPVFRDRPPRFTDLPRGLDAETALALRLMTRYHKATTRAERFPLNGLGAYGPKNPHVVMLARLGYAKINKAGLISRTELGDKIGERLPESILAMEIESERELQSRRAGASKAVAAPKVTIRYGRPVK